MGTDWNPLTEVVPVFTQKIGFNAEIMKIIQNFQDVPTRYVLMQK